MLQWHACSQGMMCLNVGSVQDLHHLSRQTLMAMQSRYLHLWSCQSSSSSLYQMMILLGQPAQTLVQKNDTSPIFTQQN